MRISLLSRCQHDGLLDTSGHYCCSPSPQKGTLQQQRWPPRSPKPPILRQYVAHFSQLIFSGRRKALKTSQSDHHNAQMTPNASFRHGKWAKIVSKTCNHSHTHELPSEQRLQKPSISPELPKCKITSRCGGVASAFSIYIYIYTHYILSKKTI